MSPVIRNVLAVFAGIAVGWVLNMGLIMIGWAVIPWPKAIDFEQPETMIAYQHLLRPRHYIFPFLAHAAGAFGGALVAAWLAAKHHFAIGMVFGPFLLSGFRALSIPHLGEHSLQTWLY